MFNGMKDYDGETSVMIPKRLADHGLLLVFCPFLGGWVQPFAWFGTKGAALALVFIELAIKAKSVLYARGAIV